MSTFWGKPFKVLTMAKKSLYNLTVFPFHLVSYDPTPTTLASSNMTGNTGHYWTWSLLCVSYILLDTWLEWNESNDMHIHNFHTQCQMVLQCGFTNLYFYYQFILHSMRMDWNGMLMDYVEHSYYSTYLKTLNCYSLFLAIWWVHSEPICRFTPYFPYYQWGWSSFWIICSQLGIAN